MHHEPCRQHGTHSRAGRWHGDFADPQAFELHRRTLPDPHWFNPSFWDRINEDLTSRDHQWPGNGADTDSVPWPGK
jgi:hypothetical protein